MSEATIACVLRSGGDYRIEHVQRLCRGLYNRGAWNGRIVCLSDAPLKITEWRCLQFNYPGWWSKLELCATRQNDLGDLLYLDLDTDVVGSVADMAEAGRLTMLREFRRPGRLGSGVMYLPAEARQRAWAEWNAVGAEEAMRRFRRHGDQRFLEYAWGNANVTRWQDLLPGQILSYRDDVLPRGGFIPDSARLVCFQQQPRPWEVVQTQVVGTIPNREEK